MPTQLFWFVRSSLALTMLVTSALALTAKANDKEQEGGKAQLPKNVREAVKRAATEGEILKTEKDVEKGKTLYEIEVRVEGGTVELVFNTKGQLIGIEVVNKDNNVDQPADNDDGDGDDGDDDNGDDDDGDDDDGDDDDGDDDDGDDDDGDDDDGDDDNGDDDDNHQAEVSKATSIEAVPAAARKVINKRAGDAKLVGVESITDSGKTVYEASWMKGDVKVEVTVTETGDMISQESSLKLSQLPKSLRALATQFAAGGELKLERKTLVLYELEVVNGGRDSEILIDATGREVEVNFDSDDDDDDDDKEEARDKRHDKDEEGDDR